MAWRRPGDKPLSEPMLVSLRGLNELMASEQNYINRFMQMSCDVSA